MYHGRNALNCLAIDLRGVLPQSLIHLYKIEEAIAELENSLASANTQNESLMDKIVQYVEARGSQVRVSALLENSFNLLSWWCYCLLLARYSVSYALILPRMGGPPPPPPT